MIIKIDNREQELIVAIQSILSPSDDVKEKVQVNEADATPSLHHEGAKLLLKVEMLPLGDIIISDDDDNELIIIERKSISDLLASIKDGRYEEQSYRLSGSPIHNHNIIYLIEGLIHAKKVDKNVVYSAIFSLNHYKGFSVMRTVSMEESAVFIVNSAKKMMANTRLKKYPYYSSQSQSLSSQSLSETITETTVVDKDNKDNNNHNNDNNNKSYSSVVKKVKKDNITADNIGEIMLCQIPGISSTTAGAIMTHFDGSLQTLLTRIKECPDCLKEVTYLNTKNQTKHLNKTIIENIVKFLSK
jgi:ERCC4-type nuclease